MIVLLELFGLWFVAATVIYVLVSLYSRSVRRERLEKEFDAEGADGSKDDYVSHGMDDYEHGLRKRLIVLVYILPLIAYAVIVYFVNYR